MFSNELWQKSGVPATYSIDQSIRFNPADSTYMQRTHGAGGNVDLFTVSFWFKRSILGGEVFMFGSGANTSNTCDITFNTSDQLIFWQYIGAMQTRLITTQVFRDTSAWYHCVVVYDSGNAISSERAKIYINGARVTAFGTETYPSQNQDGVVGSNVAIGFGRYISYGSSNSSQYFSGYLAEMHYVNGSALAPTDFGETTSDGIWIPKEYSGSYGTGGFFVDGRDSSDLGDDESGNGNDLTTSGLAAHDQVADSPTNNFAVYNILYNVGDVDFPTYSEGNLSVDYNFYGKRSPVSTFAIPTDSDAYCEFYIKTSSASNNSGVGIGQGDANNTGNVVLTNGVTYNFNGYKTTGGSSTTFGNTYTAGDIIGVYFDQSDNEVDFYKNNTLEGSLSLSHLSGDLFFLVANNTTAQQVIIANFGQDDTFAGNKTSGSAGASDSSGNGKFYYTRISGAKALCSKSLGS
jgi:hypothetical protein